MTMTLDADIAVVGAGPAGCALAIRLTQLGWRVLLLERSALPRRQSGQSLTPGVRLQLAQLGLDGLLRQCGARPAPRSRVRWQGVEAEDRVMAQDPPLLIDRGRFDGLLRGAAAGVGVRLLCPAVLIDRHPTPEGWILAIGDAAGERRVSVATLVDATGRAGLLARARTACGPATLALYADWRGPVFPDLPCIDTGPEHWAWGLPREDGLFSTLVFVDPDAMPRRAGLEAFLRRLLAASPLLGDFAAATPVGPVRAVDATAYRADAVNGPGWIAVGDAAMALDPLSSSGVQKAIRTALAAAIVLNTRLRRPEAAALADRFYADDVRDGAEQHQRWTDGFFAAVRQSVASPSDDAPFGRGTFWHRRSGRMAALAAAPPTPHSAVLYPDQPLTLAPTARLATTSCLVGDFVEERVALHHPALGRPVAWLAGVELAPLMSALPAVTNRRALIADWSITLGPQRAASLVGWLTGHDILQAACAER
ncbi:flavin-dependent monooxygenase QhpG [Azospirillum sp. B510]|uniref:flavin-dependent monooxygenase QhpG n=1 Tax=Azospirillum sp. (strain B510) TaxID=137722 RepID=UPI0002FBF57C|nr:NAD(P)/FAD-dependent oxidoreductase [Azospirillum sp. B510]